MRQWDRQTELRIAIAKAPGECQRLMSRIRILHTTTYRYLKPVVFGVHRLVVRPREGHDLQVENLLLRVNPLGAASWHRDIYGNSIALVTFSEPSDLLEFSSEATVFRRDHSAPRGLLEAHPETMPVRYSALEEPLVRAYVQSVFPDEADRFGVGEVGQANFLVAAR